MATTLNFKYQSLIVYKYKIQDAHPLVSYFSLAHRVADQVPEVVPATPLAPPLHLFFKGAFHARAPMKIFKIFQYICFCSHAL